ncbi:Ca-activated chloride channel family protein [Saccharothrix saharensis]|uniref:Ca-activated chloride channel family protein n=1 Tax=Saccharothrix saharensis TaxID=571190 RepID=A0A543JB36_9PSEU|nr:substrate-binding domain-containing protein [Saccharothrix saharensis]TQM80039.1 Ca-activated chloride channel family protein [Saccharothrix saharensis]
MRALAAVLVTAAALAGCTSARPDPVTLTVLASSELADLAPVLADLRRDTGVELRLDQRGTVRASEELAAGVDHDLAWLATNRYLRLQGADLPLSTSTMLSPLVLGVKASRAAALSGASWADVAGRAAAGELRFGMADPRVSGSGMAALIGVATAAAGTGAALRPEDVTCDKLQGFLTGRAFDATGAAEVVDEYVRRQDDVDAVVTYESAVLSLNASGQLREPLEVVYPRDGIVLSDYPLMLLKPDKRAAYDRVVEWLRTPAAQRSIMERTARRPVDPQVERTDALREPIGTALYFPGTQRVVDALLAAYDRAGRPGRVVFVLDHSTSMAGPRLAGLREAFATLSRAGGFDRFRVGEAVVLVRFAGTVLEERTVVVRGAADLEALAGALETAELSDDGTAIWSALDHAYRVVGEGTVVLMTDGENNAGLTADGFLAAWPHPPARTYAIRFGEADPVELDRVARATGGRVVDATTGSLLEAVKEIRGCR